MYPDLSVDEDTNLAINKPRTYLSPTDVYRCLVSRFLGHFHIIESIPRARPLRVIAFEIFIKVRERGTRLEVSKSRILDFASFTIP